MKSTTIILSLIMASLVLTACEKPPETPSATGETAVEHGLKHADPNYVCPMHPQIIRGEPGSCPICGMDLVEVKQDDAAPKEKKILYWVAPMDPNYRRDEPGKSPMGMDLVPVYDEGGGTDVKISPAVVQNMGIRTASVERSRLWRRIDTVGYVDFNEELVSHVHLRTDGWIEKLHVKSEGERVKQGDTLFELYSPTLVNAQEEYLQALASGSRSLIGASKDRLLALGISKGQINQLNKTRRAQQMLKIYARQDGIVANLKIREGMYVKPAMEVMTLADLSNVWLLAEVFESQADWVKTGQTADVRLSYLPGRSWEGQVEYIYPRLDPKTRTLKVRLKFDNTDEALKPNMFADITIYGGAKRDVLAIPREALIRTGQTQRVIIDNGDGSFASREVTAGIESGDFIEVQSGLREGEKVVTSGQFLIDSEASQKASLMRMSDAAASAAEKDTAVITGNGVLKTIMAAENKLNMSHEPIPDIGWPSMTMDFNVKPGVSLEGLAAQDAVMFELEQTDQGYVISSIQKQAK